MQGYGYTATATLAKNSGLNVVGIWRDVHSCVTFTFTDGTVDNQDNLFCDTATIATQTTKAMQMTADTDSSPTLDISNDGNGNTIFKLNDQPNVPMPSNISVDKYLQQLEDDVMMHWFVVVQQNNQYTSILECDTSYANIAAWDYSKSPAKFNRVTTAINNLKPCTSMPAVGATTTQVPSPGNPVGNNQPVPVDPKNDPRRIVPACFGGGYTTLLFSVNQRILHTKAAWKATGPTAKSKNPPGYTPLY